MKKFPDDNYCTADIKFFELCDEIDYWKARTKKAEEDAEYWRNEHSKHIKESIISSQKGVANALLFALHAEDDSEGNLKISHENREKIAKAWKDE